MTECMFYIFCMRRQLIKLQSTDIFQNIYLNLLLMHAQVGTELRCVSPDMYEREPIKSYYASKLLRWSVLEILIPKAFGTPVL